MLTCLEAAFLTATFFPLTTWSWPKTLSRVSTSWKTTKAKPLKIEGKIIITKILKFWMPIYYCWIKISIFTYSFTFNYNSLVRILCFLHSSIFLFSLYVCLTAMKFFVMLMGFYFLLLTILLNLNQNVLIQSVLNKFSSFVLVRSW